MNNKKWGKTMMPIKVLIADDQNLMSDGIRVILESDPGIHVVGIASNGKIAYDMVGELRPDILLMDIRMPEMNGIESTRLIKQDYPDTGILMLTTFDDDAYIIDALRYGALGYVLKDIDGDQLIRSVYQAASGTIILEGRVAGKIASAISKAQAETPEIPTAPCDFTGREIEIIKRMARGETNNKIAEDLYLSYGTVKNYISKIYEKIDIYDRSNAILFFREKGF